MEENKMNNAQENTNLELQAEVKQEGLSDPGAIRERDQLTFDNDVIAKIASYSLKDVDGILAMSGSFMSGLKESFGASSKTRGISADSGENEASINLSIILELGKSAPEIFKLLRRRLTESLAHMTGLDLVELKLRITDVLSRQEFEAQNKPKN